MKTYLVWKRLPQGGQRTWTVQSDFDGIGAAICLRMIDGFMVVDAA